MKVKELRKALKGVSGNLNVYLPNGTGIKSAKQVLTMNLVDYDLHFEVVPYNQSPSRDMHDLLIERETGLPDRKSLVEAYKLLREKVPTEDRPS